MKQFALVWLVCWLLLAGAHAQLTTIGVGGGFGPGGGSLATWDSGQLLNMALSGGNLIATGNNASDGSVRSTIAFGASALCYAEDTLTVAGASGDSSSGISSSTSNLGTAPNSTVQIAAVYQGSGGIWVNGSNLGSITAISATNIVGKAVNMSTKHYWTRNGVGNWNGSGAADPSTDTGGFDISGLSGSIYWWSSANGAGSGNTSWTANNGQGAFANKPGSLTTAGFGNC